MYLFVNAGWRKLFTRMQLIMNRDFRIIPNSRTVLNGMRVDRLDGLTSRTVEIVNLSKRRMERNVEQVKTSKGLILLKIEILNVPRFHMGRRVQLAEIS
ncbi:hypothetical protein M513_13253 [Trichuris suis]|uniref:Uncharacterized protein n=1 Tax=Trichuris suis TaxID=68888 RepID=A0A085LLL7_9BILA|nr:hypothetical protein M513_13253 [Trichuris suis]